MGEPYLEKAQRTGRLIVPSKLGAIPEEAYDMDLSELSLAGALRPHARRPSGCNAQNGMEQRGAQAHLGRPP